MAELLEHRASSVVSPTLPGVTIEAAEPVGAESAITSLPQPDTGCSEDPLGKPEALITPEMLAEEDKMSKEGIMDMERLREQHDKNFESLDDELRAERYRRLQYLLSKSNMYTTYLVSRMEKQAQEEAEKLARKESRKQKQAAKTTSPTQEVRCSSRVAKASNPEPAKPVSQKRKASDNKQPAKKRRRRKDSDDEEASQESAVAESESQDDDKAATDKDKEHTTEDAENSEGETKTVQDIIQTTSSETQQPELLTGGTLRDYQIKGYNWLKIIYENGINGILADEMGLGKTIQCIASIADMCLRGVPGPFLVVAPLSTVPNWVSEFKRFAPNVPCILYHGTKDDRSKLRRKIRRLYEVKPGVKVQPVVVTSYEVSMNDRAQLADFPWKYLIVDEGHRIKNAQCRLIKELKMYSSTHRLLLTGTPLQNNLAELWSLLNFLLPDIFDDISSFEMWFDVASLDKSENHDMIVQEEQHNHVLSMLHQILRPFMLRRMKCDVELDIPPKTEVIVYAPLTAHQSTMYKATIENTIEDFINRDVVKEEVEIHGRGKRHRKPVNYSSMCGEETKLSVPVINKKKEEDELITWCDTFIRQEPKSATSALSTRKRKGNGTAEVHLQLRNKLMLTRKICNHPYLVEYPLTPEGDYRIDEDLITKCGKMKLLDQMIMELIKRGHKILLFSQMTSMLDVLGDYLYYRGIRYSRLDGSMQYTDRVEQIEQFNRDADVGAFLLSTRAGGLGLNLVAADTVIIYDSDWNPQCDLQAQDRCHRIGQTKPVMIYRLVTANTIDQKIVERAAGKRKLEKMVIIKGCFKKGIQNFSSKMSLLSPEILKELLESKDFEKSINIKGREGKDAISRKDLDMLLSRDHLFRRWEAKKNLCQKVQPSTSSVDEALPDEEDEVRDIEGVFHTINTDV